MTAEGNRRAVPTISHWTLAFFRRVVRRYFRRHFRSVMVQRAYAMEEADGALIVYANHSSWWDPMVSVLLGEMLLPGRRHYAPMDASALRRYPILRRIGIFPVEMATARGAAQFLRTSQAILDDGGVLWITPQGRFSDTRETLLRFKPGLGALAARTQTKLLPLAIEYTFWDERLPETLLRFGEALTIAPDTSSEQATARLEAALRTTMDELKLSAMQRDAFAFAVLLRGGRGSGGLYGWSRRLRNLIKRDRLQVDHTVREEPAPHEKQR